MKRFLTNGEKKLVKKVYGDKVNTNIIRFHKEGSFLRKVFGNPAMTLPPNIYIEKNEYLEDYSMIRKEDKDSRYKTHLFIHEIGHIWQQQNNVRSEIVGRKDKYYLRGDSDPIYLNGCVKTKAVVTCMFHKNSKNDDNNKEYNRYNYRLDKPDITLYNLEQQASIISDYFFIRMFSFEKFLTFSLQEAQIGSSIDTDYLNTNKTQYKNGKEIENKMKDIIKNAGLPVDQIYF